MSGHKPFTRGGRRLRVIRPGPPPRPSLGRQFVLLLLRPATGIERIRTANPDLVDLAVVLGVIGLLRGIAEGLWSYLMKGYGHLLPGLLGRPEWYGKLGGPFLLLNIPSAHFLWLTTAIIVHLCGLALGERGNLALGERGNLRHVLQVTGVALLSYLGIGLVNFLHLIVPLPSVTLAASVLYRPNLGIGQLVTFGWLTVVCYQILRQIYGLSRASAAVGAPLPVLLSLVLYLVSAGVFFRLVPFLPGRPAPKEWLALANGAYLAATIWLSVLMALLVRHWLKAGEKP